jgi:hypothetical protein
MSVINCIKRIWWKIILSVIVFFCFILICNTFYYYLKTFRHSSLSDNPQNWGVFGDYFGGTLNPLFTLINICITIWLATIVNKISNNQIVASREIALTGLKHEALKEFRTELNSAFDLWRNNHNNIAHPTSCLRTLNNFSTNYDYLFDLFNIETFNTLNNIINNGVFTINNSPQNATTIIQNFMQANAGRQALLADLGERTLK